MSPKALYAFELGGGAIREVMASRKHWVIKLLGNVERAVWEGVALRKAHGIFKGSCFACALTKPCSVLSQEHLRRSTESKSLLQ